MKENIKYCKLEKRNVDNIDLYFPKDFKMDLENITYNSYFRDNFVLEGICCVKPLKSRNNIDLKFKLELLHPSIYKVKSLDSFILSFDLTSFKKFKILNKDYFTEVWTKTDVYKSSHFEFKEIGLKFPGQNIVDIFYPGLRLKIQKEDYDLLLPENKIDKMFFINSEIFNKNFKHKNLDNDGEYVKHNEEEYYVNLEKCSVISFT